MPNRSRIIRIHLLPVHLRAQSAIDIRHHLQPGFIQFNLLITPKEKPETKTQYKKDKTHHQQNHDLCLEQRYLFH